jgi:hypothetical protein
VTTEHASRVVTTMSDPHRSPATAPGATISARHHQGDDAKRYAALVAALIDVRPDETTARFDVEVARALAEQRIDDETARTLRWWQRASVRAAESYATTIVPRVLAVRDEAERQAMAEADEVAGSWADAIAAVAAAAARTRGAGTDGGTDDAADTQVTDNRVTDEQVTEFAAVQFLVPPTAKGGRNHTAEETRRAVRAAFALVASDPRATPTADLATTVVTMVPAQGKDARRDADPATSA